jgi:hypothetical protein
MRSYTIVLTLSTICKDLALSDSRLYSNTFYSPEAISYVPIKKFFFRMLLKIFSRELLTTFDNLATQTAT